LIRQLLLSALLALFVSGLAADLRIVFMDVGQGTATLLLTPDDRTALIDGGRSFRQVEPLLSALGVKHLDLIVASHADADHIGGLVEAVQLFSPGAFMDNGLPHTTQTYARLLAAVEESDALYLEAFRRTLTLGEVTIEVLPPPYLAADQNSNSVGILIQYGEFRALLPGDATQLEQDWWLQEYPELVTDINVYGAAHHGSTTGDRPDFLASVGPQVVVISAGQGNSYGHPREETLEAYHAVADFVLRTDLDGSVLVRVPPDAGEYLVVPEFRP
jgi:beta-lactamase superfamily II metal-dependent hydrolase